MTGILEELKWETLQKRRKDNRLILLYKGLKGKTGIPTVDLIPTSFLAFRLRRPVNYSGSDSKKIENRLTNKKFTAKNNLD